MSNEEALWQSFREGNADTPLWRILWPSGFRGDNTFEKNLKSVFPSAEMREHATEYFHGTRWGGTELPEETRAVFQYLMLDYRSAESFINSSQVARYIKDGFPECFDFIASELEGSSFKNDSDFEWSDPVQKANEVLRDWEEKTPVGADPVLYLIYDEYGDVFDEWNPREVFMVYFHGEDALDYYSEDCECTLLEYMVLDGNASFVKYKWSERVVQRALSLMDELIHERVGQPSWDRDLQRREKAREFLLCAISGSV